MPVLCANPHRAGKTGEFFLVEPLESRIAPATLLVGAEQNGDLVPGTYNYTDATSPAGDTPFILASDSVDVEIAALFAGSTDHYYIDLGSKDALSLFTTAGNTNLITMSAGRAFAFFYDANNDGIVQSNEMTGLAVAAGTSATVGTSINGDVLTSLDGKTGLFSTSLIGDTQTLKKLSVDGDVKNVLAGGAITDISAGTVAIIGAGTVGNGMNFDLGGGTGFGDGTLDPIALAAKKAGPSITKVNVAGVDSILASNGGVGGVGGSIFNITIQNDTNGFLIKAGNGGDGPLNGAGGAGGKISGVVVKGVPDATPGDLISVQAGNGGTGMGTGKGGVGGLAEKIYIGYEQTGSSYTKSADFLGDRVEILSGLGGVGKTGGNGGALTNVNVRVAPPGSFGVGILVEAGMGGDSNDAAAGKGGNGGGITGYFLINNHNAVGMDPLSEVIVTAGNGGELGATGGNGGSVTNGVVLAQSQAISSGDGGDGGKKGGVAGSLASLEISFPGDTKLTQFGQPEPNLDDIFARSVALRAGAGGDALVTGTGGTGGNITKVTAALTDLSLLTINAGGGADGGTGAGGNGGNGGLVSGVRFNSDASSYEVAAVLRTGNGGYGDKKGGTGGNFLSSSFTLTDASFTVSTGDGGSSGTGAGGNAGLANILTLVTIGQVGGADGTIAFSTGNGGDAGLKAKAGNGGNITTFTGLAWGNVAVTSGTGGMANTGTSGNGGSIIGATLQATNPNYTFVATTTYFFDSTDPFFIPFSVFTTNQADAPSASLIAGDGGGGTAPKGGIGGSISKSNVAAVNNVTIQAGTASFGGAGGSVTSVLADGAPVSSVTSVVFDDIGTGDVETFDSTPQALVLPIGAVVVAAGNGGDGVATGGKGGSLVNVSANSGYVSGSFLGTTAQFTAGNGGQGPKGGAGGAITTLNIYDGNSEVIVVAGNGGSSTGTGTGGVGGNVSGVSVLPEIMVRKVAAGDGGSTSGTKGGNGGSVSKVYAMGDIGVRYGEVYGFNTMGGIFAGSGGAGATSTGVAGSVTEIVAKSISAIVAGRAASPQLVNKVDSIFLIGFQELKPSGNAFTIGGGNPDSPATSDVTLANFVGSLSDPTVADASQFLTGAGRLTLPINAWNYGTDVPLDGLVAALVMGKKGNLGTSPNALLTLLDGNHVLISKFNS